MSLPLIANIDTVDETTVNSSLTESTAIEDVLNDTIAAVIDASANATEKVNDLKLLHQEVQNLKEQLKHKDLLIMEHVLKNEAMSQEINDVREKLYEAGNEVQQLKTTVDLQAEIIKKLEDENAYNKHFTPEQRELLIDRNTELNRIEEEEKEDKKNEKELMVQVQKIKENLLQKSLRKRTIKNEINITVLDAVKPIMVIAELEPDIMVIRDAKNGDLEEAEEEDNSGDEEWDEGDDDEEEPKIKKRKRNGRGNQIDYNYINTIIFSNFKNWRKENPETEENDLFNINFLKYLFLRKSGSKLKPFFKTAGVLRNRMRRKADKIRLQWKHYLKNN